MAIVKIKSGLNYGKEITGEFELAAAYKESKSSSRDGWIWIDINGKTTKLHINRNDFEVESTGSDSLTDEDLRTEICSRFSVMETLVDGVVNGAIKAMILSGAPGIGKTFTVDEKLIAAQKAGKVRFNMLTGSCTPIGLYLSLWNNSNPGDVLVLDDIDSIFNDQESLNLLKGALDTGRTRTISWMAASSFLRENDIPNSFEFNGTVIFISNLNFDSMIERATKLSPHFAALVSRCVYLDLGIHSNREIMIRIKHVVENTTIMQNLGISGDYTEQILEWIEENSDQLRTLSIRTILQLAMFIRTQPKMWKEIAKATMIAR